MPPPSSRMTKNATHLFRYRPGKAEVREDFSEDDESEEEEEQQPKAAAPPPKASSFPARKKFNIDLSKANEQKTRVTEKQLQPEDDLEGFVTASESEEESEDEASEEGESESEEESSEEESSDDEPKKPMLAPRFIPKAQRGKQQAAAKPTKTAEQLAKEEEALRREKADAVVRAQLEREAAARAAGKKDWDDDDVADEDQVDDTDQQDPEVERASWALRELKRVRRDRLEIEAFEKEQEEIERRRNMTAEEREQEDAEYIERQQEEREGRGKMAYMQKYFHKGAFFQDGDDQDEEVKAALSRDLAGARFADEASGKDALPEYMRIRDMTKLGKKGRTRYRDLQAEDTGRWAEHRDPRRQVDRRDGGLERSGPNAQPVGERRRRDGDEGNGRDKRPRYE